MRVAPAAAPRVPVVERAFQLAREEDFAEKLPRWTEMGPDVMSPDLTEDRFVETVEADGDTVEPGCFKRISMSRQIVSVGSQS